MTINFLSFVYLLVIIFLIGILIIRICDTIGYWKERIYRVKIEGIANTIPIIFASLKSFYDYLTEEIEDK